MSGSLNKVTLIGNLGADPEVRRMNNGKPVVNLSIATSDRWKDKHTGELKERTEWHKVVIFNERLADTIERYLKKGSKIYIEGQLQTRKWQDQSGQDRYSTEVVLQGYNSQMIMLDGKPNNDSGYQQGQSNQQPQNQSGGMNDDPLDDDVPF